jgi:hypothetical protein
MATERSACPRCLEIRGGDPGTAAATGSERAVRDVLPRPELQSERPRGASALAGRQSERGRGIRISRWLD